MRLQMHSASKRLWAFLKTAWVNSVEWFRIARKVWHYCALLCISFGLWMLALAPLALIFYFFIL